MMHSLQSHCLMHVPFEGPGYIQNWLNEKNISIGFTRFYEEKWTLPDINEIDFLIVMGGPMGVYEEEKYSWMKAEKQFIRDAIDQGKIVLGICLGSQFIAEVLGAKVFPNHRKEIGWYDITSTGEITAKGLWSEIPPVNPVFHWHGDTFEIPAGSIQLYRSENCENQAFLYKDRVLGLQFHAEVTPELLRGMVEAGAEELVPGMSVQSASEILKKSEKTEEVNSLMRLFLEIIFSQHSFHLY